METVVDFLFLCSKITADGNCSHEIKGCLLIERKAMTKLGSILKSRDITLPTKVHLVKAMVFPVVMNRCESCTIKKADTPCHSGIVAKIHLSTLKMLNEFSLKCSWTIYLKKEVKSLLYRNGKIATSFGK